MRTLITRYKTCMDKEIHEQPRTLRRVLGEYINKDGEITLEVPENINKVVLVASGSSYHCARYAADLFGIVADIEARAVYSSEFLLKPKVPTDDNLLYIFLTQSGETSDTLRAIKKAKQLNMKTMCITNKEDSSICDIADYCVNCHCGEEASIAATKSFTGQMLCAYIVALKYAFLKGVDVSERIASLKTLPRVILKTFELEHKIKQLARMLRKQKNFVITADGISYAVAKEASLKIKETSYINVSASILGEFMHGHMAVLNNKCPLIYISASGVSYSAAKNLEKIKKDYNPPIYIIGRSHERIVPNFNITIENDDSTLRMFSNVVVIQLLAHEIARTLGRNVDNPKGLEKVVKED